MKSSKYKDLVSRNPNNELFRFSLGQALMEEGRPQEAIEAFSFCLEKKADWMMAAILKGKCLLAANRESEAIPVFDHALKLAIIQHHETPEEEIRAILATLGRDLN